MPRRKPRQTARRSQADTMTTARSQKAQILPLPTQRGLPRGRAAEYLGISPSHFNKMVKAGLIPAPIALHGKDVWDRYALDLVFDALPGEDAPPETNSWSDL